MDMNEVKKVLRDVSYTDESSWGYRAAQALEYCMEQFEKLDAERMQALTPKHAIWTEEELAKEICGVPDKYGNLPQTYRSRPKHEKAFLMRGAAMVRDRVLSCFRLKVCSVCNGKGGWRMPERSGADIVGEWFNDCDACKGVGLLPEDDQPGEKK